MSRLRKPTRKNCWGIPTLRAGCKDLPTLGPTCVDVCMCARVRACMRVLECDHRLQERACLSGHTYHPGCDGICGVETLQVLEDYGTINQ